MNNLKVSSILLLVSSCLALVSSAPERGVEWCASRTGLLESDIVSWKSRNDNCTIDCTTQQELTLTFHVIDGLRCRGENDRSRCFMGMCLKENEPTPVDVKGLHLIDIFIKSAKVDDKDSAPGTGDSDPFVVVEIVKDGEPSYRVNQTVCHTYIVQDEDKPRWNNGRGFLCRPMPMRKSTYLRFVALDSDKPFAKPDKLGTATMKLDDLLNQGTKKLRLEGANRQDAYVEVSIDGSEYRGRI